MLDLTITEWLLIIAVALLVFAPVTVFVIIAVRGASIRSAGGTPARPVPPEDEDEMRIRVILREHRRIEAASRRSSATPKPPPPEPAPPKD